MSEWKQRWEWTVPVRPHGTHAAYMRHYRHGEPPCDTCREAASYRSRQQRSRVGGPVRDLAILVPSRGRPASVARLVQACRDTCTSDYRLIFGFDGDDPAKEANIAATQGAMWMAGRRKSLAEWTNVLYHCHHPGFGAYASLGDDHVPVTHGWDTALLKALEATGGGFAYCSNGHQNALPEMCVVSSNVAYALGWVCEPSLKHYCVDTVWKDLGEAAGCLHYLPDVVVEHRHWAFGLAEHDLTYYENMAALKPDAEAHTRWKAGRMAADAATVRQALRETR